jgi:hypothetical protein
VLDSQRLKEFLFFDDTKGAYRCPHCLEGRNQSDDEREFVQLTGMRRAMVNYMNDKGDPLNAYPAFWGPFSVVGEGAAK